MSNDPVIQMVEPWDHEGVVRNDQVEACYGEHADSLSRFAVSLVGASDAPDILSAAILKVLQKSSPIDDLHAYLYRCVHRAALHHWRTQRRRTRREDRVPAPSQIEDDYSDPSVAMAILTMSPRQRAVVHLTYWEDLTTSQIAERLDISIGTVKRHRARAHQKLSEALTDG